MTEIFRTPTMTLLVPDRTWRKNHYFTNAEFRSIRLFYKYEIEPFFRITCILILLEWAIIYQSYCVTLWFIDWLI